MTKSHFYYSQLTDTRCRCTMYVVCVISAYEISSFGFTFNDVSNANSIRLQCVPPALTVVRASIRSSSSCHASLQRQEDPGDRNYPSCVSFSRSYNSLLAKMRRAETAASNTTTVTSNRPQTALPGSLNDDEDRRFGLIRDLDTVVEADDFAQVDSPEPSTTAAAAEPEIFVPKTVIVPVANLTVVQHPPVNVPATSSSSQQAATVVTIQAPPVLSGSNSITGQPLSAISSANNRNKQHRSQSAQSSISSSTLSGDICRICHCEGTLDCPLIMPCRCSGSLKYVHQKCLQLWIKSSQTRSCEVCRYNFLMQSKMRPISQWEKLDITTVERRKILCSVTFHAIAVTCVVWSLYVLIDRTAEEVAKGNLNWPFWTKLVVVAIGFTGGLVFMYVQCKMYVQLCRRWKAYNKVIYVQNCPETVGKVAASKRGVSPFFSGGNQVVVEMKGGSNQVRQTTKPPDYSVGSATTVANGTTTSHGWGAAPVLDP